MAIQFRRGAFADFIKSKMVAGEPAVVQSGDTSTQNGKAFYICYTPGSVDRVLTEQDKTVLDSQISDIEDDLAAAEQAIENVRQSIPAVDATLTTTGAAADAKKTGDEIADLKSDLEQAPGLTDTARRALLACFAHVAWVDGDGQDYYDALEEALYEEPVPDQRIVYEISRGTDISDWSIDTEQHAFTLDENFTFLAKVTTETAGTSQANMFLIDSASTSGVTVGMRVQAPITNGAFVVGALFNGGANGNGAGGSTVNFFSINTNHDVIIIIRNNNKTLTIKTYIDGTLEYQDSRTLSDKQNTYPPTYYIGKNHNDAVRYWLGTIDIYRIYNEALTDAEITNILGVA